MSKWIGILLLSLVILSGYSWAQDEGASRVAICLLDFTTPTDADLTYIVEAINTTIVNRLSLFPNAVIYGSESAPAKYFREPDRVLAADKVRLLQIRRETGFDGLIFGKLVEEKGVLMLTLHLVDFSSGRVYFTGKLQGSFGSALLGELEKKIGLYADALVSYYNCALTVTSEPSGAEIWVNGRQAGVTPVDGLDVKAGLMSVQVKMQDYLPSETEIELKPGQKGTIHTQLYKHSLTATSQPPQASVYLNEQFVGVTPLEDLTIEQQEFTVRFTKKGYAPYSESISLSPGEQAYVHAELYDQLIDHLRNKESSWEVDSHNFSLLQTLEIQDLGQIEIDAFSCTNLRYHARFGRFAAGIGMGVGILDGSQHFDTFLDTDEGYESITIQTLKGTVFSQYNIVDKLNWLEIYLGASAGFSMTTSDQPDAPNDLDALQRVSPLVGGELGVSFYLTRMLKLSAVVGGYYAGELEYAAKEASYWGQPEYKQETVGLHPFYLGLALTISLWPSLM